MSRELVTRIAQKHDKPESWAKATAVKPLAGEIIIYDVDTTCSYVRMKVGDGIHTAAELPFIHAGMADKLTNVRKISFTGAFSGHTTFDGSTDIIIATALAGKLDASFTGTPETHTHTVTAQGNMAVEYTPAGQVTGSVIPVGTISAPETQIIPVTKTVSIVTQAAGTNIYTPGSCIFPTLHNDMEDGILTLSVEGGSYTPGTYIPGSPAITEQITYIESATAQSSAPTFTGASSVIQAAFEGVKQVLADDIEVTANVSEAELTPAGSVVVTYNTED